MQVTSKVPTTPSAPAKPSIRVFVDGGNGAASTQTLQIPQSHDDMMGLLAQRRLLNDQLEQATNRRNDLLEQLNTVPETAKHSFQAELNVVSDRIVQLESNLNVIGQEIAAASPSLASMAEEQMAPTAQDSGNFEDGVAAGVFSTLGGVIVLMLFGRWIWKRSRRGVPSARQLPAEDSERLKRLENGVEAMAIEIERISEGQRFVTRLMSESRGVESTTQR